MNNSNLVFTILIAAYAYYFMTSVLKRTKKDAPLTGNEKTQVIIMLILSTVVSWAILYFGWKDKLPTKAHQVAKYVKWIIGILLGTALLGIIVAVLLVAINPRAQIEKAQNAAITPTAIITQQPLKQNSY
jgi:membrane protease YdiL (CAAX protease family)